MAFVVLRRSRNTRSYYLVESYRDETGAARKRTLCYLGREEDGTNTVAAALEHWRRVLDACGKEIRKAKGDRKLVLRRRHDKAAARVAFLQKQLKHSEAMEAARRKRAALAQEARLWSAFDQLRRNPNSDTGRAAKQAFLILAKRYHPDVGGSHQEFLRLKKAYDAARAAL